MTSGQVLARRKKAAEQAIKRRWRQDYINEHLDRPGKFEGVYRKPTLIVRVVRSDD
jgi:hypothetical protein